MIDKTGYMAFSCTPQSPRSNGLLYFCVEVEKYVDDIRCNDVGSMQVLITTPVDSVIVLVALSLLYMFITVIESVQLQPPTSAMIKRSG